MNDERIKRAAAHRLHQARKLMARQGLEKLAAMCLPASVIALTQDVVSEELGREDWERCGQVAAVMAVAIREGIAAKVEEYATTEEADEYLERLALQVSSDLPGAP